MSRRFLPLVAVALTLVARPALAQALGDTPAADTSALQRLAGCWALEVGTWSTTSRLGPPVRTREFRLDTVPMMGMGRGGARAVTRLAPRDTLDAAAQATMQSRRPPLWRAYAGDSVEAILWLTGTEAEVFYGRLVGRELRGVMRLTSDAIPRDAARRIKWDAWPWAPAVAQPLACPATS